MPATRVTVQIPRNASPAARKKAVARARAEMNDQVKQTSLLRGPVSAEDRPKEVFSEETRSVPAPLRQQVAEKLTQAVRFARSKWGRPFRMPSFDYGVRGKTAGKANTVDWHLSLNAKLLVENPDHMLGDTLIHELAHLITCSLYGGAATAHGKHWKSVMLGFGLEPSRAHSMDVLNAAVGELLFKYRCSCEEHPFTPKKHGLRGSDTYTCAKCQHTLVYAGEVRDRGVWRSDPRFVAGEEPAYSPKQTRMPRRKAQATATVARPAPPSRPTYFGMPTRVSVAPSPELQQYALALAQKLGLRLDPRHLADKQVLSTFVDQAKALVQAGAIGLIGSKGLGGSSGGYAAASTNTPTNRQLDYARAIAAKRRLAIPATTLASRAALSRWIDTHQ